MARLLLLGNIGALLTYLGILYVLITILFNPNYSALFAFAKPTPSEKKHLDNVEEQVSNENETRFKVINTIKDEEVKKKKFLKQLNLVKKKRLK